MTAIKHVLLAITSLAVLMPATIGADDDVKATARLKELDAYWAEVSRCVNEGDFAGYTATTHPDGVLVAGTAKKTYPLAKALAGWEKDFIKTKSGKMKASVIFRFNQRLNDETTAHETGIFLYSFTGTDGSMNQEYIHFEALLVKRGSWKIMMEYQKSRATKAEWDQLVN